MDKKYREINIWQFVLYLWEKVVIILCVAAVCAGGMMLYNYSKQKSASEGNNEISKKDIIKEIIDQNRDATYTSTQNPLPHTYATYAVTPDNTGVSYAKLYVDFNYDTFEGNENLDFAQMTYRLQNDATALFTNNELLQKVIDKLKLKEYEEMSDITSSDLKWMIVCQFAGANIMHIYVTDVDGERAAKISETLIEEFIESSKNYAAIDEVKVVDAPTVPLIRNSQMDKETSANSSGISKRALIKAGIIGAFIGGCIVVIVLFIMFVLIDPIRTADDIYYYELNSMGVISKKTDRREEDYKRLAYNLTLLDDCKRISIVPVDKQSEDNDIVPSVTEALKKINKKAKHLECADFNSEELLELLHEDKDDSDIMIVNTRNIKDYADATLAATNTDAIVLVAKNKKTQMKSLGFANSEMGKTGVKIAGVVLIP